MANRKPGPGRYRVPHQKDGINGNCGSNGIVECIIHDIPLCRRTRLSPPRLNLFEFEIRRSTTTAPSIGPGDSRRIQGASSKPNLSASAMGLTKNDGEERREEWMTKPQPRSYKPIGA